MTAATIAVNLGKTICLPLLKQYGPQLAEKIIIPFAKQKYTEFIERKSNRDILVPIDEYTIIN